MVAVHILEPSYLLRAVYKLVAELEISSLKLNFLGNKSNEWLYCQGNVTTEKSS